MWIRENDISAYLRDIKKIAVLTPSEEEDVITRIKDGDENAINKLICANLRFVITIAKSYQNQGLDFHDLIAEGNHGLVKAAKRFDSTVGVRFFSYAVWWIRQSIMQALNDHARTVRLPVNIINDMSKNRRDMTENEYADWCVYQGVIRTQSLNQSVGEDGEELCNMIIGGYNDAFHDPAKENRTLIEDLLEVMVILNDREREIIQQYYGLSGEESTLQQIADDLNLTKERVRQIKNQAIKKLRFNAPLLFKFFQQ